MSQESQHAQEVPVEEPPVDEREQPLFKLVIVSSGAFLITVLSLVVTTMFPSESPASRFISRNGLQMIGVEVVLIIVFGILAMAVDRRRTVMRQRQEAAAGMSGDSSREQSSLDTEGQG